MDDSECDQVKYFVFPAGRKLRDNLMEKDLFNVLQSEVEIAKCRKYHSELIELTITELVESGQSGYADMIKKARELSHSSLYFSDFSTDQFEYFKTALIWVLLERQLGHFKIVPE